MTDKLIIHPDFRDSFSEMGLTSCRMVIRYFSPEKDLPFLTNRIKPVTWPRTQSPDPTRGYFKTYGEGKAQWNYLGRKSKALCEYRNYQTFTELEIPTIQTVACGEIRDSISRLSGAFILTVELPNAVSLVQFYREQIQEIPAGKRKQIKDAVIRQLAMMTKKIHSNNFFHHDLVWRNVLIRLNSEIQPELYWIDCPRGSMETRPFLRNRKRIKDLASLDKCGAVYFSRRERLEFLRTYLGLSSKSQEIRRLIFQVQSYRKKRWPDDWLE